MQTFADKFLNNGIMYISSLFNRCSVIMDQHSEESSKEGAREDRGSWTGIIVIFDDCSEITPNYITKFLSNVTSKTNPTSIWQMNFLVYQEGNIKLYIWWFQGISQKIKIDDVFSKLEN